LFEIRQYNKSHSGKSIKVRIINDLLVSPIREINLL
jgi:hypothetical protein